jgi:hypothetical protein
MREMQRPKCVEVMPQHDSVATKAGIGCSAKDIMLTVTLTSADFADHVQPIQPV